ncbi:MAG: hypothetical protein QM743_05110 [Chitinophagaceae bacterium]
MKNLPLMQKKSAGLPWLAVAGAAAIVGGAIWLGKRYRDQRTASDEHNSEPHPGSGYAHRNHFRKSAAKGNISRITHNHDML